MIPIEIHRVFATAICLHPHSRVEAALDKMAHEMNQQLTNANPIFLCVLLGGAVPFGNLLPRLHFPLQIDYVHVNRYENNIKGGELKWRVKPTTSLKSRTIVVIDDVLDGGVTLKAVMDACWEQGSESVFSAVLVDKKDARDPKGLQSPDFYGLTVDNHYIFGYGMDYKGYLRNAPGIYRVAPEFESKIEM